MQKNPKKTNAAAINNINKEAQSIAERLRVDERVEQSKQHESFVTLKEHKKNFQYIQNGDFLNLQNLKSAFLVNTILIK